MILVRMNWTSTTVPLWQVDCESFRRTQNAFELRDVTTTEHRDFVKQFAARYHLTVTQGDGIARFEGTKKKTQTIQTETRQLFA
jgi:hypothetical protein